jgi:hypothetical protein
MRAVIAKKRHAALPAVLAWAAWAASPHRETFDTSLSGWTHAGFDAVAATNGVVRFRFHPQSIPLPQTGVLSATNTSSGGAFYGDYRNAQLALIGFRVFCSNQVPAEINLVLRSQGVSYRRNLSSVVTATGQWHAVCVALTSTNEGRWIGPAGEETFRATLTNITAAQIEIARSGASAQDYVIDDIFVEIAPGATASVISNDWVIVWSPVISNRAHRVQRASEPGAAWQDIASVTSVAYSLVTALPLTNGPVGIYRLGASVD